MSDTEPIPTADVMLAGRVPQQVADLARAKAGEVGASSDADVVRVMAAAFVGRPDLAEVRRRGRPPKAAAGD